MRVYFDLAFGRDNYRRCGFFYDGGTAQRVAGLKLHPIVNRCLHGTAIKEDASFAFESQ
jgi:hypothetical protein